jgi:tRNA modification GTPase
VLRVSGPEAFRAGEALCGRLPAPRMAGLRRLVRAEDGAVLDEALVLTFPGPASATGEDLLEIQCHGSPAVVDALLAELAAHRVRLAEPGEFTRRAFEAGRLDLTQVEGLADLLSAATEAQRAQAAAQAGGALRRAAERWRNALIGLMAGVEAEIDFADEADTIGSALDRDAAERLIEELGSAVAGFSAGERVREGVRCAIVGSVNAGKSALLNALAGRDAAIVSDRPGTTRDVIEVQAVFGGVPVTLMDTAGLRDSADPVEAEGIARARARAAEAELVLAVSAYGNWADAPPGAIRVWSKADLREVPGSGPSQIVLAGGPVQVSALTGAGLDALRSAIAAAARAVAGHGEPQLVTRGRQRDAVARARDAILAALGERDPALQAEALRRAAVALERLAGRSDVEDVLGAIFSRFCIGK